jgi:methylglutaconyl-CoA hydratase
VGHKIARDLLVSGRIFDAAEAHRLGLVNEVVEAAQLMPRVRELAASLQENSPASMRATKALINGFIGKDLDRQFADSIAQNAEARATADFREGVTSFLEKRKPKWTGN